MRFLSQLGGMWSDIFSGSEKFDWMSQVFGTIEIILWIALALVGAAGALYAIYVGIQMARADSEDKRKEAKNHLIIIVVAVAVTIVLVLFFNTLLPLILEGILGVDNIDSVGKALLLK